MNQQLEKEGQKSIERLKEKNRKARTDVNGIYLSWHDAKIIRDILCNTGCDKFGGTAEAHRIIQTYVQIMHTIEPLPVGYENWGKVEI